MDYPLRLTFKILALAPQIYVRDSHGRSLLYVKQRLFKLKEAIHIFLDESQRQELFTIKADRIIDFSAKYFFQTASGETIGAVQRSGMKSLWRVHYTIFDNEDQPLFEIHEENPWIKVLDGLVQEIPILGVFAGLLFHPAYVVSRVGQRAPVLRLAKRAAFFEGRFDIEPPLSEVSDREQKLMLLSLLMLGLLERRRG